MRKAIRGRSIGGVSLPLSLLGACTLALSLGFFQVGNSDTVSEVAALLRSFLALNAAHKIQTEEAQALLVGEAKSRWELDSLGGISSEGIRIVVLNAREAAAAATGLGDEKDVYFYLARESGGWRIHAMRTMARSGLLASLVQAADNPAKTPAVDADTIENIRLTLQSDRQLSAWFFENQETFDQLVSTVKETVPPQVGLVRNDFHWRGRTAAVVAWLERETARIPGAVQPPDFEKEYPRVVAVLRRLRVSSVLIKPDRIQVIVGGILDDSVGYWFSPSDMPPPISPDEYIWAQKLADHWYLYRTT